MNPDNAGGKGLDIFGRKILMNIDGVKHCVSFEVLNC
jgi:hypothetical protein